MARTEGPYIIGQPGGPSGPFYSLVNGQGRVVAMQIPNKDDAVALSANPDLLAACEGARDLMGLMLYANNFDSDTDRDLMQREYERHCAVVAAAKGETP